MSSDLRSINALSELTGRDRRTVKRLLTMAGIKPDKPGKYNLPRVLPILFAGEPSGAQVTLNDERIRTETAKANLLEMEEAVRRGELIPFEVVETMFAPIRSIIIRSKLSKDEKNDILSALRDADSKTAQIGGGAEK